ncbi:NnrS family protein [Aliiroseovarius sp.]|uniref:NnrS family protein n=1 Tax=Aliiroseovarius sp. TaxID=1872442 RepID=UPI0026110415|nr:NnrS family protein [Aliiroseovarius sp.]
MRSSVRLVLQQGHRTFFLLAPLWAILAGIVWELWLLVHATGGMMDLPGPGMAPHLWHGHEMIFGYAAAAVAGFLLTSLAGARAGFITLAAGLWLAGRLVVWASGPLPGLVVATIDLAFLPLLAGHVAQILIRRRNPQQAVFLVFLAAMTLGNLLVHLDWLGWAYGSTENGLRIGIMALIGLIAVLGGRVTPGFIRNALRRAGAPEDQLPPETPRLDRATVALAILLPWSATWPRIASVVALGLAIAHSARLIRWRLLSTRRDALLWALALAQSMLPVGLVLWALSVWKIGSEVAALHVLGLGVVGGMTLAVMSRAILAHSGRGLVAPAPVAWAYALMAFATAVRWLGSTGPTSWYFNLMLLAGAAWILAFTLFLAGLIEALTTERPARPAPPPPPPLPPEMKSPHS